MDPESQPRRGRSRFFYNTAALGTSMVFTAFFSLVQFKILAAYLTPSEFGLFAALRGFSILVSMLAVNGLSQVLVRFLPYHESKKQFNSALVLSGACYFISLFLLTVFVFIIESSRGFFFGFAKASELIEMGAGSDLMFWLYATMLGGTLKLLLYGGFIGLRRLPAQVTLELLTLAVQVVWFFLWRDRLTMPRLFMVLGVTSLATCAAGIPWYFAHLYRDIAPTSGARSGIKEESEEAGEMHKKVGGYWDYWFGATGLALVAVAFNDVDRYALSHVLTLSILSQFHVASRILQLIRRFLAVPILAFQPEVSRLDAEGRGAAIETITKVFFKFNATVAVASAVSLWAFAPEAVRVVSSARYDAALPLLRIFLISVPLVAMTAPLTSVMKALDQVRQALYCDLAWAITYLFLLVTLGAKLGLVGTGVAHVTASATQLLMAVSLSRLRVGAVRLMADVSAKSAISGAVAFAPLLVADAFIEPSPVGVGVKVALLGVALALYRSMARLMRVFDVDERETLITSLSKRRLGSVLRRIV